MTHKIIVEDFTKPQEPQGPQDSIHNIDVLKGTIFMGAAHIGQQLYLSPEEVMLAMFTAAEDMAVFMQVVDSVTTVEILSLRRKAFESAIEKRDRNKDNNLINGIAELYKRSKVK